MCLAPNRNHAGTEIQRAGVDYAIKFADLAQRPHVALERGEREFFSVGYSLVDRQLFFAEISDCYDCARCCQEGTLVPAAGSQAENAFSWQLAQPVLRNVLNGCYLDRRLSLASGRNLIRRCRYKPTLRRRCNGIPGLAIKFRGIQFNELVLKKAKVESAWCFDDQRIGLLTCLDSGRFSY